LVYFKIREVWEEVPIIKIVPNCIFYLQDFFPDFYSLSNYISYTENRIQCLFELSRVGPTHQSHGWLALPSHWLSWVVAVASSSLKPHVALTVWSEAATLFALVCRWRATVSSPATAAPHSSLLPSHAGHHSPVPEPSRCRLILPCSVPLSVAEAESDRHSAIPHR
jgi:hypothetical protein